MSKEKPNELSFLVSIFESNIENVFSNPENQGKIRKWKNDLISNTEISNQQKQIKIAEINRCLEMLMNVKTFFSLNSIITFEVYNLFKTSIEKFRKIGIENENWIFDIEKFIESGKFFVNGNEIMH